MTTVEEVRRTVSYDPATGVLTRLRRDDMPANVNARTVGKPAGNLTDHSYSRIWIGPKQHLAHRLAWVLMTGEWPSLYIDHIDGDRNNNRWNNLRLATRGQNAVNSRVRASSGLKGVYLPKKGRSWVAQISINRKNHYLGTYPTAKQANDAYFAAAVKVYGQFARRS